MWTWSISGTGVKSAVIAMVQAQTCPLNDDGTQKSAETIAQYQAAQAKVVADLTALPDGVYTTVSVSGNDTMFKATTLFQQPSGPLAGQMVSASPAA